MRESDPLQQIAAAHTPEALWPEEMPEETCDVADDAVPEIVGEQTPAEQDPRLQRIEDYAQEVVDKQDHGDAVIACCIVDNLKHSYRHHLALDKALALEDYSLSAFEKHMPHTRELRKIDNLIRQSFEAERKESKRSHRDPLLQRTAPGCFL